MIGVDIVVKLAKAFPGGFLNGQGEFIAHKKANEYFKLVDCETELDVKCKVLEWLSRGAYKAIPFHRALDNTALHIFMLKGINDFLGTRFSVEDIEKIYTRLGNRVNHQKTVRFVESGYNMAVLEWERDGH